MCLSQAGLKAFMLVLNVLLFLCGAIVMGVGIWAVADKVYISDIIGTSLFSTAAILMVICGICLIFISLLGCFGAISQRKIVILVYGGSLVIVFIMLMTAAIIAAVFKNEIEGSMQEAMREGLRQQYGYNTAYTEDNAELTEAWDMVQTRLTCCAVDDQGWGLYQQSRWFQQQFNEYDKKFVPASCCIYEGRLNQYVNLFNCQSYTFGPPRFSGGAFNNAVHYRGCYTAAKDFLSTQANIILGIGFSFCVFLIAGVVIAVMFIRKLSDGGSAEFRS